ncbi:putative nucleosome assembly protein [Heterostelium album PN500]|uniref:Putative nucleosome assembly protein n=1 Tax=Heterostelium pallidum (strain ATCC 26659 / Pp 5 / PN500) TaxID=670386 RepID=D3BAT1_HETP5|nr:putative nucleosome assembly protein [Heterostelium album PN500]EFA81668.1 putative nucleosome assembly protein [Heterostelium album PN500]|eukprot:XP_020433785.1 putative nucleosome assembly protein [Heterostelium album PN500]
MESSSVDISNELIEKNKNNTKEGIKIVFLVLGLTNNLYFSTMTKQLRKEQPPFIAIYKMIFNNFPTDQFYLHQQNQQQHLFSNFENLQQQQPFNYIQEKNGFVNFQNYYQNNSVDLDSSSQTSSYVSTPELSTISGDVSPVPDNLQSFMDEDDQDDLKYEDNDVSKYCPSLVKEIKELQESLYFAQLYGFISEVIKQIQPIPTKRYLPKGGHLSYDLDPYINAEQINRSNPLVSKNLLRITPLYTQEITNLNNQLKTSLEQFSMIESLVMLLRPLSVGEHDAKVTELERIFMDEKVLLGTICNLSKTQVENWFGNKRVRVRKSNLQSPKKIMSEGSDIEQMIAAGEDLSGVTSTQVLKRVNALLKLDDDHTEISKKLEQRIRLLELEFQPQFDAIYQKRTGIVTGEVEATETPKEPLEIAGLKSGEEKGIPNFWYKALMNHPAFADVMGEEDDEALQYLTNISIGEDATTDNENQVLTATFHFAPNAFFTNSTIVMTLTVKDGDLDSIKVTPVQWNEGKKFFVRTVEKKIKKKGPKGKKPTVTTKMVTETIPSIFGRFLVEFDKNQIEEEPENEEDIPAAQLIYIQYQALISLKDEIVPDAVNYFLGRAQPEGDDGYGDEFGEEFDDEEDEDEDDDVPQLKSKSGGVPPQPNNPECKQQ